MSRTTRIVIALTILCGMAIVCGLPHGNPTAVDLTAVLQSPSRTHPLGTDDLGRDVWALLAVGFWRTVNVVLTAGATSILVGVPLGLFTGYVRGAADAIIMTITDLSLIVPTFVVALLITSVVGLTPFIAGLILGIFGAGAYINQTRMLTLTITSCDYIRAEVLLATPTPTIIWRHILPGVSKPLLRYFGASASAAVIAYAGLAFIGLGVDTTVPDWGMMLFRYRSQVDHPMLLFWPSAGIFLLAATFHLLADPVQKRGDLDGESG